MLDTESTGHIEGVNWEGIYIGNAWRPGYELQGADKIGKQVIGSENPQLTKYWSVWLMTTVPTGSLYSNPEPTLS